MSAHLRCPGRTLAALQPARAGWWFSLAWGAAAASVLSLALGLAPVCARAEGPLTSLSLFPTAAMLATLPRPTLRPVTALGAGSASRGRVELHPTASEGRGLTFGTAVSLVRLALPPAPPGFAFQSAPATRAGFALPSKLPEPPGITLSEGPRVIRLHPDVRMTRDRRGALFSFRGTF